MAAAFSSFAITLNYMGPPVPSRGRVAATAAAVSPPPSQGNFGYFYRYCDSTNPDKHRHRGRAAPIFSIPLPDISLSSATEKEDAFTSTYTSNGWAEFADRVSGEWDGFGADFTEDGKPMELPESVVPEAYREWEVKVYDWQTQCPTLAQFFLPPDDLSPTFFYKTIKLLPTVGCEADAATRYSIQERRITSDHPYTSPSSTRFAYQATSGCYVAVWPVEDSVSRNTNSRLELEHSLIDPRDKESRVRIIQVLEKNFEGDGLRLKSIKVFVEQWYGPFRDGDQLGGCAIRDSAFASTQPLDASRVTGSWQGLHATASFQTSSSCIQQLVIGDEGQCHRKTIRNEDLLVLLPKQLWCSLKIAEDGATNCEAGWFLEPDLAITSKCTFSSTAELQEIAIATETLSPVS